MSKMYKLPEAARNNAKQVLEWRDKYGDEVKGMTEVGWRRARQLADNAEVDLATVKKMSGFIRHQGYYEKARAKQKREGNPPWTYPAIVALLGWGGESGIAWARRISEANP